MEMTDKEELRHDAETGRRYKIAGEVLKEFLEGRKNELIRELESSPYADEDLRQQMMMQQQAQQAMQAAGMAIQGAQAVNEAARSGHEAGRADAEARSRVMTGGRQ